MAGRHDGDRRPQPSVAKGSRRDRSKSLVLVSRLCSFSTRRGISVFGGARGGRHAIRVAMLGLPSLLGLREGVWKYLGSAPGQAVPLSQPPGHSCGKRPRGSLGQVRAEPHNPPLGVVSAVAPTWRGVARMAEPPTSKDVSFRGRSMRPNQQPQNNALNRTSSRFSLPACRLTQCSAGTRQNGIGVA